jgi:hypothetical protein
MSFTLSTTASLQHSRMPFVSYVGAQTFRGIASRMWRRAKAGRHAAAHYEVIEYDDSQTPERELRRTKALDISREAVVWHAPFGPSTA